MTDVHSIKIGWDGSIGSRKFKLFAHDEDNQEILKITEYNSDGNMAKAIDFLKKLGEKGYKLTDKDFKKIHETMSVNQDRLQAERGRIEKNIQIEISKKRWNVLALTDVHHIEICFDGIIGSRIFMLFAYDEDNQEIIKITENNPAGNTAKAIDFLHQLEQKGYKLTDKDFKKIHRQMSVKESECFYKLNLLAM